MQERPILFMRTGVLLSHPEDFFHQLSKSFDCDTHSTSYLKRKLADPHKKPLEVRNEARNLAMLRSLASLKEGRNVIYEGYLNQRNRREELRESVAEAAGALAVLLAFKAPDHVIDRRIIHRANSISSGEDALKKVSEDRRAAHNMRAQIEWPESDEPHLVLHGRDSPDQLLENVTEYVAALLSRDES